MQGKEQVVEFADITMAPNDPILILGVLYRDDPSPNKVNLGIGAYRDNDNKSYVFDIVRKAEERVVAKKMDKEYLPMDGDQHFLRGARQVIFGWDHPDVDSGRVGSL